MDRLFFSLLALALQWFRPRYNAQLQVLQAQIRILRSRIDVSRIVPTPQEKAELLRLGALLGHDVAEVMHVVQPETYRRWVLFRLTCQWKSDNRFWSNYAIIMIGCRSLHFRSRQGAHSRPATHNHGGR